MLIILSNPTDTEIQFVDDLLKAKGLIATVKESLAPSMDSSDYLNQSMLSPQQFQVELAKRGYSATTSKTRKKIARAYGIHYEKRGRELWFANKIKFVPSKTSCN